MPPGINVAAGQPLRSQRCHGVDAVSHHFGLGAVEVHHHPIGKNGIARHSAVVGYQVVCVRIEQSERTVLPGRVVRVSSRGGVSIDVLIHPSAIIEPGIAGPAPVVDEVARSVLFIAIEAPLLAQIEHLLFPGGKPGNRLGRQFRMRRRGRSGLDGEFVGSRLRLAVAFQSEGYGIFSGSGVGRESANEWSGRGRWHWRRDSSPCYGRGPIAVLRYPCR